MDYSDCWDRCTLCGAELDLLSDHVLERKHYFHLVCYLNFSARAKAIADEQRKRWAR